MITFENGNIFDFVKENDIVLHQVNCQGVMGAGIAKQIKLLFPNVYKSYNSYCKYFDNDCLGSFLPVNTNLNNISFTIGNCFGQRYYGRGKQTDYNALKYSFEQLSLIIDEYNRILIPYGIGCGLAGGDWNVVFKLIKDIFKDCNVLIVKYNK